MPERNNFTRRPYLMYCNCEYVMQCIPKNVIKGEKVDVGSQKITLLPNYGMDGCTLDVTCNTPDVICLYYDQR